MTNKQALRGLSVEAHFYLAECCNCGEVMPSSKLIESRNYMDGDADCYCPHCNADDCDIADMGSAASEAWNYQQKRIETLLDELEAKDKRINFLKERLAQLANFNPDWDALEAATDSLREHMEELTTARARIAELEAREVKLPGAGGVESTTIQSIKDWADGWKAYREEAIKALADAGIRINGEG